MLRPEMADEVEEDGGEDLDEDLTYLEPDAGRWRWVAAVAGAVLLTSVVGTIVIVTGRDSATSRVTVSPSSSRPVTSKTATPPPTPLPPETVTTLTPSAAPTSQAAPPPETSAAPPPQPRTIVYTVSGTKAPLDPVTVTYTDETGALRTDVDVALPWTKTVVPTGNVLLNSVTAVSFASHLNCAITDGGGQTLVSQNFNTIVTTCNH